MKRIVSAALILATTLLPTLTRAGSNQDTTPMLNQDEVVRFSTEVQETLAVRGAHVAIVGRVGRDPDTLPNGIEYTHVAYWVYSQMLREDGTSYKGYRVYNLYQQGKDGRTSRLIQDSPADFFAGAFELNAGIIIPDKRLQKKLMGVIASPAYSQLHNPSYSVLANPTTLQFQNCTEHTLDVLMASLYGTTSSAQIKANIAAHFDPHPIKIGGIKRVLAPAASPALTTADHSGRVATATFGSIARFMQTHDLDDGIYRQRPGGAISYLN
ncbi:DUF2145 domain-containing protein [uncultured Roseobacter sp.]|uniref:DUF2145 domain-containing protein n=1 Tax=uncultured Roseobacter sp. TaxID=114847 RepID=UPI00262E825F|nr:DUF2145 domain-containing protein [uncultured Roseobacter sp.]